METIQIVLDPVPSGISDLLPQQSLKVCLLEVPIMGERRTYAILPHDQETGAIGDAPAFVGHVLIEQEGVSEGCAGLGDHNDTRIASESRNGSRHHGPKLSPALCEAVEQLR